MRIIILGTAAATAVPLPFCHCETCCAARVSGGKDVRKRSSAIVNDELLLDLSPDLASMAGMYGIDTAKTRFLLQTHAHTDHFDAGHFVTRSSMYASQEVGHLDIVASKGTLGEMNRMILANEPTMDLFDPEFQRDANFTLHEVHAGETFSLGEYCISALDAQHDERTEALIYLIAYRGRTFLYATDLRTINESTWELLAKNTLDVVLIDQTYGAGHNAGGHLDAGQVAEIVREMKRLRIADAYTQIYATHISHEGNGTHEQMEEAARPLGYRIAWDGMIIQLDE